MANCKYCGGELIPKNINGKDVFFCSTCNKAFVNKKQEKIWLPNMDNFSGDYEGYYYDEVDGCYYEGERNEALMEKKIENARLGIKDQNLEKAFSNINNSAQGNTCLIEGKCPNCGAMLDVDPSKEAAVCQYCGTPYIVKKAIQNYYINITNNTTNNIRTDVVNIVEQKEEVKGADYYDSYATIRPEFDKDEFKRRVLIYLGSRNDTPQDITTIDVTQVKLVDVVFAGAKFSIDINYTATIGYDREEQYWEKVKKRDSEGRIYYTNELKTRIVTDWKPFQSRAIDEDIGFSYMSGCPELKSALWGYRLRNAFYAANEYKITEINIGSKQKIPSTNISEMKRQAIDNMWGEVCRQIPGDKHKDERKTALANLTFSCVYKFPMYVIEYTYNQKKYVMGQFAYGKKGDMLFNEIPTDNKNAIEVVEDKTTSTRIMSKIFGFLFWPIAIGMVILGLIYTFNSKSPFFAYYTAFGVVPLFFLIYVITIIVYKCRYKSLFLKYTTQKSQEKIKVLKESLAKNRIRNISVAEENNIVKKLKDKNQELYNGNKHFNSMIVLITIFFVITLIANSIAFGWAKKVEKASPEYIYFSIKSINKNETKYIVTYVIKSNNFGLNQIDFTHHIYQDNKEITSFKVNGYLNLDKNKSKEFYVECNMGSNFDPFYISSYTHKIEINECLYSNGPTYDALKNSTKYLNNWKSTNTVNEVGYIYDETSPW